MRYYRDKSTPKRLIQARETLHNAQHDEEIKAILYKAGYTEAEFADGNGRLESAEHLGVEQDARLGEQVQSTAEMNTIYIALRKQFNLDREVIRRVTRSNQALYEGLRLHLRMKEGRGAFIQQASHFYEEVITNPVVVQQLADEQHTTPAFFTSGREGLTKLITAINVQQQKIGQAQVTTRARQAAMQELDEWIIEFNRTARFAFRGNERHLKKLGMTVRGK